VKIIILDDSITVRLTVASYLEDMGVSEDEIFSFEHGEDALKDIEVSGVDLIFCDMHMPGMSGCEFAQKVFEYRHDLVNAFFVISAEEDRQRCIKMREIGARRFLKKPIQRERFSHFVLPEILKRRTSKENENV